MRQIQGHYGGSTWAGATQGFALTATAHAALVTPAHAIPEARASTKAGPKQVPDPDRSRYFTLTK
jgi:hypothetical protein